MEHSSTEAPVWTERFRIRSYDVDGTQRAIVPRLCAYFLEAAWNHAEALGFGFAHLQKQSKYWVLSRLRCEMEMAPRWGQEVTLRTWPRGFEGAFAFRDFELLNEKGARFGAGTSAWLVLDTTSKRPQRLHKIFPDRAALTGRPALAQDPEKLGAIDQWDSEMPISARYSDIDVNRHVTASRYLAWIVDSYPTGFHDAHWLRLVSVNYLSETVEGEHLLVRTGRAGAIHHHSLTKADGTEVCRARLEWITS